MNNRDKENIIKEKFKQALVSTARVISEDFKDKDSKGDNKNPKEFDILNVGTLNKIENLDKIDIETLVKLGLIDGNKPLKILGNGEFNKKLEISANHFSKTATEKIKSAGGSIKIV